MSQPVTFAICGCGARGLEAYAPYQERHPDEMKVVAGADIRPERLAMLRERYDVPPERCFASGAELLAQPRLADVMIVATQDRQHVAEALRLLVALRSTIKKGRVFLEGKLEAGNYSAEDSALFEALGGVWKLEDLNAIGSVKVNAKLVQLPFDVSYDEAKKEYVERGWWLDVDSGRSGRP